MKTVKTAVLKEFEVPDDSEFCAIGYEFCEQLGDNSECYAFGVQKHVDFLGSEIKCDECKAAYQKAKDKSVSVITIEVSKEAEKEADEFFDKIPFKTRKLQKAKEENENKN